MLVASPFWKKVDNWTYFIKGSLVYKLHTKGLIVLISCFFLSACKETIIREVTPTTSNQSGPTLGSGSNMVAISDTINSGNTSTPSGNITGDPASSPLPTSSLLLEDPSSELTIGTPGITVNCLNSLPCRWVSADTQFALTVTSADNIASRNRLSLSYVISTTHDSTIVVSAAGEATDSEGLMLRAEDQSLGESNGGTPVGLLAGDELPGIVNFNKSATGVSLSDWSISVLDSGVIRTATFTGIPLGSLTTAQADCRFTLPCVWTTPDNDVAITLQTVGGISTNNRVTANFSVETSSAMTIAVDEGSTASGSEGTLFEGRTLGLGFMTDYKKLTAAILGRSPYYGSVHFYRTPTIPAYLHQLSLVVYQDEPVPRWNPQFINVPLE
jgi:hypothetical protein